MKTIHWIIFCVLLNFIIMGCISNSKKDYTFIEIPKQINSNTEKRLSLEELKYDKKQILYTLRNAYSGQFLPGNQYKTLLKDIESIQAPINAKQLCETLNEYFDKFPDNHLQASMNDKPCIKEKRNSHDLKKKGNVGKNYYKENYYKQKNPIPWNVKLDKKNTHTALLISIINFPLENSSAWDGFLNKVKKLLPGAQLVIIDLRGNNGGSDSTGYKLSSLLAGVRLKIPYKKQQTIYHPASFQIMINSLEFRGRQFTNKNKEYPQDLKDYIKIFTEKRDKLIKGETVSSLHNHDTQDREENLDHFDYEKSIKKPIYILIDSRCGSSGESTVDFFE